ncbi:uncharacterized protein perm1b isoform 2-T2 [Spinachia spinachia]
MGEFDHSLHIAECDWRVFYEVCDLPQLSFACHHSSDLSDSEDSGSSSPVFSTARKGPLQKSAADGDEVGSSAAGCCTAEENDSSCENHIWGHITQSGTAGGEDDLATKAEMYLDLSVSAAITTAEHVAKDPDDNITTSLQTEQGNVPPSEEEPSELKGEVGDVQMESDVCDPLSGKRAEMNMNKSQLSPRAVGEDGIGIDLRGEKEHWFVTVNVGPAPQRARAVSEKRKTRPKRNHKDNIMCRPGQDRPLEAGSKLQMMKENDEFKGGPDAEDFTTENRTQVKKSAEDPEGTRKASRTSLTSGEEDSLSEGLVTPPFPKRSLSEPMTSGDSMESDEFEDVVDFSSTHSSDSESFLSAAESLEEPVMEQQHLQSTSSPSETKRLFNLTENTAAQDGPVHSLSRSVTAPNSEGHERADPPPVFPSARHRAPSSDTCGPPQQGTSPSASGRSTGDSLLSVPDSPVTPRWVADGPEAHAEAAGHIRPVYAISAFWDEMEKLTINDILQLRMGSSSPARGTRGTVTPQTEDLSPLEDAGEHDLCDGGLTDVSDTADSGYFTQPDESRPDRSSWDFSTSDAEEEYSQFPGASGNLGPEHKSEKAKSTGDAPILTCEEDGSTSNEGEETLVPSEDIGRKCLEEEDSSAFISSRLARPRQIRKSKSMQDVHALNTEDLSLQLLVGSDESSRFLRGKGVLKAGNSLLPPISAPFMDGHYEFILPVVFQDSLREDKTERHCVAVYEPEDTSVSPVIDFPLWTFRDEMPFSSQRGDEKLIPIFSSSHPTVRELTFPNPPCVFLSTDREDDNDDFSPIGVLSRSFTHGSDCGAAAPQGFYVRKRLMRKIRFPDKGSGWRGTPGCWGFPVEGEKMAMKRADPPLTALTERSVSSAFGELAAQQRVWEAFRTTRREGVFSTLKQSDMCLVCIAFASWVLKSSDPEGADAWKAAVLANVSALSAITYLRQYVKKKNPS